MAMAAQGKKLMSLKLMVDHDTYLRPGESIELRGRDIVPPVRSAGRQYRWHSVIVRDSQDLKPDKVGIFDNSVPLNSPGREYLGPLMMARVSKLNNKDDFIYPFSAAEYRKCFQSVGELLNIKSLHPYQTRHGGASEDLNSGERDAQAVKDQRSMAYRSKRAKVREGGEDPTTDGNFVTKSHGVLSVVASKHGENAQGPSDPSDCHEPRLDGCFLDQFIA